MKNALLLTILILLSIVLTSCSATVQTKPEIRQQLCRLPDEPVFERINREDPDEVKMLKLLNNIADLKSYAEKLKAVIECLQTPRHNGEGQGVRLKEASNAR